ncbi:pilin [Patescibacteria group bacterium]|nr:pilin [Patescibacteria group bacterium]
MKIINKIKIKLILLLASLTFLPAEISKAQNPLERLKSTASQSGYATQQVTPAETVATIIIYVLGFIGLIFLAVTIFSGFQWMTAGGNEEKISEAKKRLQYAVIGLLVILAAYTITIFVSRALIHSTTQYYYGPYP